jgi:hypothetical protein
MPPVRSNPYFYMPADPSRHRHHGQGRGSAPRGCRCRTPLVRCFPRAAGAGGSDGFGQGIIHCCDGPVGPACETGNGREPHPAECVLGIPLPQCIGPVLPVAFSDVPSSIFHAAAHLSTTSRALYIGPMIFIGLGDGPTQDATASLHATVVDGGWCRLCVWEFVRGKCMILSPHALGIGVRYLAHHAPTARSRSAAWISPGG